MINANDNSGMMNRIAEFVSRTSHWPERSSAAKPAATTAIAPSVDVATVAGRYEFSNNNMLTLAARGNRLFTDVDGLPDDGFLFMGGDRFGSTSRNVSFRIARNASGEVVGLNWSANSGKERPIPRIGPLFASIEPVADPNPSFTKTVETVVRAFAQGDAAVRALPQLTPGARTDLAVGSARAFAGVRGLAYLSAQDVSGRGIERHGGAVSRVLFYRMETDKGHRWLMLYVTSDNLITDYDVVIESE